jgi:hypothetical protein
MSDITELALIGLLFFLFSFLWWLLDKLYRMPTAVPPPPSGTVIKIDPTARTTEAPPLRVVVGE